MYQQRSRPDRGHNRNSGALEEADWQCCKEPTFIYYFFFNCLGKCLSGITLPWGNSTRQVRPPPAPTHRNPWAKLQQQVGHFSPFICQICRSGISKDQVLIGLPHKKCQFVSGVTAITVSRISYWKGLSHHSPEPWEWPVDNVET